MTPREDRRHYVRHCAPGSPGDSGEVGDTESAFWVMGESFDAAVLRALEPAARGGLRARGESAPGTLPRDAVSGDPE